MAIDHDQRRATIAQLTIDLVAREGIEAATIRRIAASAGFSTTAVTHYFADKQDLLAWAYQVLASEGEWRFEAARRDNPDDPVAALMTMVPWCPVNVRRWKAYLAFWDQAARDAELAGLLTHSTQAGLALMRGLLCAQAPGSDPARIDRAVEMLNAVIQGMALQMLVDPAAWSPERVRVMLGDALAMVSPGAAA
ncbi:MAG TPA: TetR family transcriptional regulator C-terminal domain-containing protein [Novosphingobium sp.]|nr:TetR family transcriptional regulator C-terminal domain-containing protein [Novosphingobium sp.]